MNLFRLLVLVLLAWWVIRFVRSWKIQIVQRQPHQSDSEPEVLRACANCRVRVPARSLDANGCCSQCRTATRGT